MGCTQSSSVSNTTSKNQLRSVADETQKDFSNFDVVPASPAPPASPSIGSKVALGCGCYWGTEKYVVRGTLTNGHASRWFNASNMPLTRLRVVYSLFLSLRRLSKEIPRGHQIRKGRFHESTLVTAHQESKLSSSVQWTIRTRRSAEC